MARNNCNILAQFAVVRNMCTLNHETDSSFAEEQNIVFFAFSLPGVASMRFLREMLAYKRKQDMNFHKKGKIKNAMSKS